MRYSRPVKGLVAALLLILTACGPAGTSHYQRTVGIPAEAREQERARSGGAAFEQYGTVSNLVGESVEFVDIRYFDKDLWEKETGARQYVLGLLKDEHTLLHKYQIWSQGVTEPEIECLISFKDAKDRSNKSRQQGRLLIWQTVACFRDASGQWWFVSLFDYYHQHHPAGARELVLRETTNSIELSKEDIAETQVWMQAYFRENGIPTSTNLHVGMTLDEFIKILGAPTRDDKLAKRNDLTASVTYCRWVQWQHNPLRKHGAPTLKAKIENGVVVAILAQRG